MRDFAREHETRRRARRIETAIVYLVIVAACVAAYAAVGAVAWRAVDNVTRSTVAATYPAAR